jgi:adenine-specific DNA-methyltransferase
MEKSNDILQENINKLKELFPEIQTEDKIDFVKQKSSLLEHIKK